MEESHSASEEAYDDSKVLNLCAANGYSAASLVERSPIRSVEAHDRGWF